MKRFNFMRIIFLLGLFVAGQLQAQHEFLSSFTASVVPEGVFLEWTIIQGTTCLGVTIERADPKGDFAEIGRIEEVCGSIDEPVDYSFLDETPVNGSLNSYRLILGLDGTSEPVSVEYFNVDEAGFSVTLNEASGTLKIFTIGQLSSVLDVLVYDVNGREVDRIQLNDGDASLNVSRYNGGLYLIAIKEQDQIIHIARVVKSR